MVRIVCLRRHWLRKDKELFCLRIGLLVFVMISTVQFTWMQTCSTDQTIILKSKSTTVARPVNPSLRSTVKVVQRDPLFVDSRPSGLWDYRPGNRSNFLTIGIPSVRRHNTRRVYLYDTLTSLIKHTSDVDKSRTRVVVFLTDLNRTYNQVTAKALRRRYPNYITNGFISTVSINQEIYPNLTNVKRTFNDSMERVRWRAKQNIDFAYMFWYSSHISEYYMQLEDDVIAASGFITDMKKFIDVQKKNWFLLEFSKLGFIGKLFKSVDLGWMANFLYQRYDEMPCDLLLGGMRKEKGQCDPIHSNRSLFQHIGKFSSLKNKFMPAFDDTFKDIKKVNSSTYAIPKGDNPPARIKTNIAMYDNHRPEFAYDSNISNFFWGTSQKTKDYFTLIFEKPQNISRIILVTGAKDLRQDALRFGELRYSRTFDTKCGPFHKLAGFIDGQVDTLAQGAVVPNGVTCLLINVKKSHKTWLIIWRIEVFLRH